MKVKIRKSFRKHAKKYVQTPLEKKNLSNVIDFFYKNKKMPTDLQDHQLRHQIQGVRDCHLSTNLVIIYYISNDQQRAELIDVGPHDVVFKKGRDLDITGL